MFVVGPYERTGCRFLSASSVGHRKHVVLCTTQLRKTRSPSDSQSISKTGVELDVNWIGTSEAIASNSNHWNTFYRPFVSRHGTRSNIVLDAVAGIIQSYSFFFLSIVFLLVFFLWILDRMKSLFDRSLLVLSFMVCCCFVFQLLLHQVFRIPSVECRRCLTPLYCLRVHFL